MAKIKFNEHELEIIDIDKKFRTQKIILFLTLTAFILLILALIIGINYMPSFGKGNIVLESISFTDNNPIQASIKIKNIGDGEETGFSLDIISEGKKTSIRENLPLKPTQIANYGFEVSSKNIEIYLNGKKVY